MNDNYATNVTTEELIKRTQPRFFDRITMVTNRFDTIVENLTKQYAMNNWNVEERSNIEARNSNGETVSFNEKTAVAKLGNVELCVTQPLSGETPCATYYERYGEGLCCVRENLDEDMWEKELNRYKGLGIPVLMTETDQSGKTVWFDMMDIFGGLFALHLDSKEAALTRRDKDNDRQMTQINITTDDVDRTVKQLTSILEMGPWSIGSLNNTSVTGGRLLVDGEYTTPEFWFQLGITFYSNIEFEVIQPVKGPTVYKKYIDRHGVGYHHIKEVVEPSKLQDVMADYEKKGYKIAITGSVGPTTFGYIESEEDFGFYLELGDGIPPETLPEGYNEYMYPEK